MLFSKDNNSTPKKYKYKIRKEHIRITLVDENSQAYNKGNDSINMGKVPLYDGRTPKTDPFGSYTGVCEDIYEVPVQDVDDL